MAERIHRYEVAVRWSGNTGTGTSGYRDYGREYDVTVAGKPALPGSADAAFRGDAARWNPEEFFIAALAACHQLWYLHLCADAGVIVTAYEDRASGAITEHAERGGWFTEVVLRPLVTVAEGSDPELAASLHAAAHAKCFVANSVSVPVRVEASVAVAV